MASKPKPQCPPIPDNLLEYLAARFERPLTAISRGDSERDVGILIGKATVIDYLRRVKHKQDNDNNILLD